MFIHINYPSLKSKLLFKFIYASDSQELFYLKAIYYPIEKPEHFNECQKKQQQRVKLSFSMIRAQNNSSSFEIRDHTDKVIGGRKKRVR